MHASKKNQYPTGIYVLNNYPNRKEMDQKVGMTLHVIAYRSKELLFGTHAFNFNCFLDDFNCVFMQISCLSVLLDITLGHNDDLIRFW